MSFFKRLFSSEYRKALAAEAEGDFLTAARNYALCGEEDKVADMHLARARAEDSPEERVKALNNALSLLHRDDGRRRTVLRLLGRALRRQAKAQGTRTEEGRRLLTEAASVYEDGELWEKAGNCYMKLGDRTKAADAYSKAGMVEKVEELLTKVEEVRGRRRREEDLFKDYEMLLQGGKRDEAIAALRECVATAAELTRGDYRRLLNDLEQRILTAGHVTLEVERRKVVLVGRFPLWLGRDADCELQMRGPAISRRHASIRVGPDGGFIVEDAGSHNGTLLNGLQLGAPMPLPPEGGLELGPGCAVEFRQLSPPPSGIRLEVTQGLDKGKLTFASLDTIPLAGLIEGAPPLVITFDRGRPMAHADSGELRLNAMRLGSARVQLIRGDLLELRGQQVTVEDRE